MQDMEAALVIDNSASPQALIDLIDKLIADSDLRHKLAANIATTAHPNAATTLADIVIAEAHKKPHAV